MVQERGKGKLRRKAKACAPAHRSTNTRSTTATAASTAIATTADSRQTPQGSLFIKSSNFIPSFFTFWPPEKG